jgi:FkbM family methyltransferase
MGTLNTVLKLLGKARGGATLRDKKLAFLLAGLSVMGEHRQQARARFKRSIDGMSEGEFVRLGWVGKDGHSTTVLMRAGNEGDYLMTGEFVQGGYDLPDFTPRLIIDGGANIGLFLLHVARVFPNARLVAYEPSVENFRQLEMNVARNGVKAELRNVGLWSHETELFFHDGPSHKGEMTEEATGGEAIRCVPPEFDDDCWMKLDIEGAEYEVLPALFNQGKYPRWLSLEIHYYDAKRQTLLDLLRETGYTVIGGHETGVFCTVVTAYRR